MSHLLATVNPEAAGIDVILPPIGETVIFIPRPGEGRNAMTEFAAIVRRHNPRNGPTGLDLLVIFDARDMIDVDSAQRYSDQLSSYCWKPRAGGIDELTSMVQGMREDLERLKQQVFGDWNPPEDKSVMDYLVQFEKNVQDAQEALEAAAKGRKA